MGRTTSGRTRVGTSGGSSMGHTSILTARTLGFDICSAQCILRRPSDRVQQRQDLEEEFLRETGIEYAEVRVLNSKGQVEWDWHSDAPGSDMPTYLPEKGDVWGNRAKAKAVLGHQAMVFTAYMKGGNNSSARSEKVNVLRDSGATRNFVHPAEAERRGLTTSPALTPLRVTLGGGKEVTCNGAPENCV